MEEITVSLSHPYIRKAGNPLCPNTPRVGLAKGPAVKTTHPKMGQLLNGIIVRLCYGPRTINGYTRETLRLHLPSYKLGQHRPYPLPWMEEGLLALRELLYTASSHIFFTFLNISSMALTRRLSIGI